MNDKMAILFYVVTAIICWLLGVLFFVLRKKLRKKVNIKKKICTGVTTGIVVSKDRKRLLKGDAHSYYWVYTYEYCIAGVRYQKEGLLGQGKKMFEEGQKLEIYYNPSDLQEIYVLAEKEEKVEIIFVIFSAGFFCAGFITFAILFLFL